MTVLLAMLITERGVLAVVDVRVAPSGLTVTPSGMSPTSMVSMTVLLAVSITDTVSSRLLAM